MSKGQMRRGRAKAHSCPARRTIRGTRRKVGSERKQKGAQQKQQTQKKQATQAKHEHRQQACWRSSCQALRKRSMAKAARAAEHSDHPQQAQQAAKRQQSQRAKRARRSGLRGHFHRAPQHPVRLASLVKNRQSKEHEENRSESPFSRWRDLTQVRTWSGPGRRQ